MTIIFCVVILFAIIIIFARHLESKHFNKGKCIKCNAHLRHFSTDSQHCRGYICDKCGYTTWVSYNIDKH